MRHKKREREKGKIEKENKGWQKNKTWDCAVRCLILTLQIATQSCAPTQQEGHTYFLFGSPFLLEVKLIHPQASDGSVPLRPPSPLGPMSSHIRSCDVLFQWWPTPCPPTKCQVVTGHADLWLPAVTRGGEESDSWGNVVGFPMNPGGVASKAEYHCSASRWLSDRDLGVLRSPVRTWGA